MVSGLALPNAVAMLASAAAMALLAKLVPRIGGQFGWVLKLMIVGVFFSVFLHAGVELAECFGAVSSEWLMSTMGVLLTIGSISFCAAGVLGAGRVVRMEGHPVTIVEGVLRTFEQLSGMASNITARSTLRRLRTLERYPGLELPASLT
jgi:hypothetical protein